MKTTRLEPNEARAVGNRRVQGAVKISEMRAVDLVELLTDCDTLWFDTAWESAEAAMKARKGETYRDVEVILPIRRKR